MDGISKEFLCKCLNDTFLVNALEQYNFINNKRRDIIRALEQLNYFDLCMDCMESIKQKADTMANMALNYQTMIENSWGLTPWQQKIIINYLDLDVDSQRINELPSFITD